MGSKSQGFGIGVGQWAQQIPQYLSAYGNLRQGIASADYFEEAAGSERERRRQAAHLAKRNAEAELAMRRGGGVPPGDGADANRIPLRHNPATPSDSQASGTWDTAEQTQAPDAAAAAAPDAAGAGDEAGAALAGFQLMKGAQGLMANAQPRSWENKREEEMTDEDRNAMDDDARAYETREAERKDKIRAKDEETRALVPTAALNIEKLGREIGKIGAKLEHARSLEEKARAVIVKQKIAERSGDVASQTQHRNELAKILGVNPDADLREQYGVLVQDINEMKEREKEGTAALSAYQAQAKEYGAPTAYKSEADAHKTGAQAHSKKKPETNKAETPFYPTERLRGSRGTGYTGRPPWPRR